ncbi:MAG TPA: hypothetical protein VM493_12760 [Vicinamibacterales bacterium]|nr:hypothetical protein [Vicinamibacterales bacterium]
MQVSGVATVLPVDDLKTAVHTYETILGTGPTFVDGDRWAQFDLDGRRIALAGTDRVSDRPALMLKVDDLEAARTALVSAGLTPGDIEEGPHELRITAEGPGGWPIVVYTTK